MSVLKIKYIKRYKDRHGKERLYFNRKGYPTVTLRGPVGSLAFNDDYAAAMDMKPQTGHVGARLTVPGSIDDLIVTYYQSSDFRALADSTKMTYRGVLEKLRVDHGDKSVKGLQRRHVLAMLDQRAEAGHGAAYSFLKRLKVLLGFAVARGYRDDNPALTIKPPKLKGFRALDDSDIERYLDYWKPGTRQRLAMLTLLYSGQRLSDIVKMGKQHVRNGRVLLTQQKTKTRLEIQIHPIWQAEIDLMPADVLMFVHNLTGGAYKSSSFGNEFRDWCKEAGLPPQSSAHGVRKAAGRRMAEAGVSAKGIMSVLGHTSLSEAERYTKSADQIKLADDAISKLR